MVLLEGIELSTSPLPRECSTTELPQPTSRSPMDFRRFGQPRLHGVAGTCVEPRRVIRHRDTGLTRNSGSVLPSRCRRLALALCVPLLKTRIAPRVGRPIRRAQQRHLDPPTARHKHRVKPVPLGRCRPARAAAAAKPAIHTPIPARAAGAIAAVPRPPCGRLQVLLHRHRHPSIGPPPLDEVLSKQKGSYIVIC
jgi:hypothetical protein